MFLSKFETITASMLLTALLAGGPVLAADGHDHPAHPGDPVKQEEHMALFDLVSDCDATHQAAKDGNWGDATTWDKDSVPGNGARVVIPKERTVIVAAKHDQERVDWIRVDGKLRFDLSVDTALKVVTLVGNVKSSIEIVIPLAPTTRRSRPPQRMKRS